MPKLVSFVTLIGTVVTLTSAPSATHAQLPRPHVSLMGGVAQFDLSGTGTARFGAVRVDLPVFFAIAEGSLGVFRPKEDPGRRTYMIPEVQLQWQFLPFVVKPYLGAGVGYFRATSGPSPHPSDVTLSASGGVRVAAPLIPLGVRGELRVRGIGSRFTGSTAEWTIGVTW
jgi:hypothetical protein